MSVASLSITSDREQVVDFSNPFMTRYISVLMKVPRKKTSYFEASNDEDCVHFFIKLHNYCISWS